MKKFLLIAGTSLLILVVVGIVAGRMILKTFVESDEFREQLGRILTRGAHGFVAKSIVDVSSLKLVGLMSLESGAINVRSTDKSEHVVTIASAIVKPKLVSLLSLGPVQFEADITLKPRGTVKITGRIPLGLLSSKPVDDTVVEVSGDILDANAVELTDLMQTAQGEPYFRLTEGTLNGSFRFEKPLGKRESSGEKAGQLSLTLSSAKWTIPSEEKIVPIETLPIELKLKDFVINIEKPIVLKDESGTATLSGSINLPKFAEQEKSWDITANVDGSSGLLLVVTKLFKCPAPPAAYAFIVKGSFSEAQCLGR